MTYITDAFEEIAHSLRILVEAHARAMRGLMELDRDEAVGNIEHALTTTLNAFASLYDAMEKEGLGKALDWYATPELAIILLLRNARHHNHAKKIRTIYSYYIQEANEIGVPEKYLLVDVPSADAHDNGKMFEVFQSWGDLLRLFAMPRKETKIREATEQAVRQYMHSDMFAGYATRYGVNEEHVFFNVIPFLVNAGIKITPCIKDRVQTRTGEGEAFLNLFTATLEHADTSKHTLTSMPFLLPLQH
jgi:hypothetical protein